MAAALLRISEISGYVRDDVAEDLGLPKKLPVAGVGIGIWPDVPTATRVIRTESETTPDPGNVTVYRALYDIYHQLYGRLQETFGRLSGLDDEPGA